VPINNRYFNGQHPDDEKDSPPEDTSILTFRFKTEQHQVIVGGKNEQA
jgi:hypothetical protein